MPARERTLVDTGPLVALLVGQDLHHAWARRIWAEMPPPLFTCQSVLSETQFLIGRFGGNPCAVLEFVQRGAIRVAFDLEGKVKRLLELQESYRSLPMSLADACLVCMAEEFRWSRIMTTDSHFHIYRRHKRQLIPLLTP